MITKFWGRNFGKIGDFAVDLSPLTLLVGPNSSGKSSFLRGLRLLAMLNRTPLYGKQGPLRLGFRATLEELFPQTEQNRELRLGVECESSKGRGSYQVALSYRLGQLRIVHEMAQWKAEDGKTFSHDSEKDKDKIETEYRGATLSSAVPRGATLGFLFFHELRRNPALEAKIAPLYDLIDCFAPFHVYRFSPSAIARPVELGETVSHDGMGLSAELDRMLGEERENFDRIVDRLTSIFTHIKKVNVITIKSDRSRPVQKGLVFETKGGVRVPAEFESDGVLLTLAYLWLSTCKHHALGVEEPETATYPSLLEDRWRLLKSMAEGASGLPPIQVVATTHSSFLLTAARDPSLVRVFEPQEDGLSRIYKPPEEFMHDVIYKRLGWSIGEDK